MKKHRLYVLYGSNLFAFLNAEGQQMVMKKRIFRMEFQTVCTWNKLFQFFICIAIARTERNIPIYAKSECNHRLLSWDNFSHNFGKLFSICASFRLSLMRHKYHRFKWNFRSGKYSNTIWNAISEYQFEICNRGMQSMLWLHNILSSNAYSENYERNTGRERNSDWGGKK